MVKMQITYYFYERIGIECQRIIDLSKELDDQFSDPDLPVWIHESVYNIQQELSAAVLRLRKAEAEATEKRI